MLATRRNCSSKFCGRNVITLYFAVETLLPENLFAFFLFSSGAFVLTMRGVIGIYKINSNIKTHTLFHGSFALIRFMITVKFIYVVY
jgi:hypothetical protein